MPAVLALVTMTATFRDAAGDVIDPTIITAEVSGPGGIQTSYSYALGTITKSGTGVYTFTASCDIVGQWKVSWYGETSTLYRTQSTVFEVS